MFGIVGPNGAGKSTLLRIMAGIYAPDNGTVTVKGKVTLLAGLGAGFQRNLTEGKTSSSVVVYTESQNKNYMI